MSRSPRRRGIAIFTYIVSQILHLPGQIIMYGFLGFCFGQILGFLDGVLGKIIMAALNSQPKRINDTSPILSQ